MTITTPKVIDNSVMSFCQKLAPESEAIYVPVDVSHDYPKSECFFNVRNHIKQHGGNILYGWQIWLWPRVFVEAEYHSIWVSPDGEKLDLTPKSYGEQKVLFLHKPGFSYDYQSKPRLKNIRKALSRRADVVRYLEASDEIDEIISHKETRLNPDEFERLRFFQSEKKEAYNAIVRHFVGVNQRCPCGSGLKYKKCHLGKSF